jgi:hypothetical protein
LLDRSLVILHGQIADKTLKKLCLYKISSRLAIYIFTAMIAPPRAIFRIASGAAMITADGLPSQTAASFSIYATFKQN